MKRYLHRMRSKEAAPPRRPTRSILWSWLGSLVGIYVIGASTSAFSERLGLEGDYVLGSFGAAAVLVYGAPLAEFSQPRNLVVGNLISAGVGVFVASNLPGADARVLAAAIAFSSSVLCMNLTRTMHPPGGATALIAVVGGDHLRALGYWYLLFPVLTGSLILLAGALVVNNLSRNPQRHYPVYWY
jgi:CBS domain-containing membrane protein